MSYTPVDKLNQLLDYIDGKTKIDKNVIYHKVLTLFEELEYQKTPFNYKIPIVYRGVMHKDDLWFDNVSKFGIAPKVFVGLSRCNWPKEPIFYCSNDNGVPVFECRASERIGEFFARSSWVDSHNIDEQINHTIDFLGITLGVVQVVENLKVEDSFRNLLLKDDIFKVSTPQLIKDFDRAIGELFRKPGTDALYWLTSSITKYYFTKYNFYGSKLEGLIYPSVESHETGTNAVFSKEFVRNNLRLLGVALYQIIAYDPKSKEYTIKPIKSLCNYENSGPNKGQLMWQKVHSRHHGDTWILSATSPILKISPNDDTHFLTLEDDCI